MYTGIVLNTTVHTTGTVVSVCQCVSVSLYDDFMVVTVQYVSVWIMCDQCESACGACGKCLCMWSECEFMSGEYGKSVQCAAQCC